MPLVLSSVAPLPSPILSMHDLSWSPGRTLESQISDPHMHPSETRSMNPNRSASATQRMGRRGRCRDGIYIHLSRPDEPDVGRTDESDINHSAIADENCWDLLICDVFLDFSLCEHVEICDESEQQCLHMCECRAFYPDAEHC